MRFSRVFAQAGRRLVALFPERHLYVRSGGEMRGYILTTRKQIAIASCVAVASLWMGVSTAAMLVNVMALSASDRELARTQARYERWIADRQARLNSAVAQLNATSGPVGELAETVEKRHAALALLLSDFKGDLTPRAALAPSKPLLAAATPADRVQAVRIDQERLIAAAETYAKTRADRLRLAFRLAGLNPNRYVDGSSSLGGPLIEAKDPRALAAVLDVDEDFALRIQRASTDMADVRSLSSAARKLPLARPANTARSSGFGVRLDPFTRRPAFHSGLDFSRRDDDPDPCDRAGRGVLRRASFGLWQHHRDRPRRRLQDPLRPPADHLGRCRPARRRRSAYRRHGFDRPLDRPAPALRSVAERPRPEPGPLRARRGRTGRQALPPGWGKGLGWGWRLLRDPTSSSKNSSSSRRSAWDP